MPATWARRHIHALAGALNFLNMTPRVSSTRLREQLIDMRVNHGNAPRARLKSEEATMNGIIYLVGLVVVVMAVLSLLGLR
jgi:hypothetical protein